MHRYRIPNSGSLDFSQCFNGIKEEVRYDMAIATEEAI
ncbi:hypothetical protein QFZ80_000743 [Paenibacillus sp. V4I7]|nr:hypothetical protein [Paenibacillus sp. V4I7]MDQ0916936.1 hypothetical protein [Paenibacillus sp. V4I5]